MAEATILTEACELYGGFVGGGVIPAPPGGGFIRMKAYSMHGRDAIDEARAFVKLCGD